MQHCNSTYIYSRIQTHIREGEPHSYLRPGSLHHYREVINSWCPEALFLAIGIFYNDLQDSRQNTSLNSFYVP